MSLNSLGAEILTQGQGDEAITAQSLLFQSLNHGFHTLIAMLNTKETWQGWAAPNDTLHSLALCSCLRI